MRTIPIWPPVANNLPVLWISIAKSSSDSPGLGLDSKQPSAYDFLMSQNVILRSWPTLRYLLGSTGESAILLMPPILTVWLLILFWLLRSQHRIDLSLLEEIKWMSSAKMITLVTLLVCSFKWAMSSRDLISQTLISPSWPPETINLLLWLSAIAVTPFLCALSICQSCWRLSTRKALIFPSEKPERMISSVNKEHVGKTPEMLAS